MAASFVRSGHGFVLAFDLPRICIRHLLHDLDHGEAQAGEFLASLLDRLFLVLPANVSDGRLSEGDRTSDVGTVLGEDGEDSEARPDVEGCTDVGLVKRYDPMPVGFVRMVRSDG